MFGPIASGTEIISSRLHQRRRDMCIISTASKKSFIEVGTEDLPSGSMYMLNHVCMWCFKNPLQTFLSYKMYDTF